MNYWGIFFLLFITLGPIGIACLGWVFETKKETL